MRSSAPHNARVRAAFRRIFAERNIALHEHRKVRAVTADGVALDDGTTIAADAVLVTTDAAPPPWFAGTGLARDDGGFLAVGPTLQVRNDPDVFAAGDCAGLAATRVPRPACSRCAPGRRSPTTCAGARAAKPPQRLAAAGAPPRADLDRRALRRRVARHLQGRGRLALDA